MNLSGHQKNSRTSKNKESHWAPPRREVFASRKSSTGLRTEAKLGGLLPLPLMMVKDMPFSWSWPALCAICGAMFLEGCCYKGAARPLTRSAKKRSVARDGVFALVVLGACVLGVLWRVRLCFISTVPLHHLTRNSTYCMISQKWRRVSCEQQLDRLTA